METTWKFRLRLWLDRWADRLVSVAGAVTAAQGPEFFQQYLQRLGGHVDEARRQVSDAGRALHLSGEALQKWLVEASHSDVESVRQLSGVLRGSLARLGSLQSAQDALKQSSLWTRPFVFVAHFDSEVFVGTWSDFRPGVPTTGEGLVYAFAGIVIALGIYHLGVKRWWQGAGSVWEYLNRRKKTRPRTSQGRV